MKLRIAQLLRKCAEWLDPQQPLVPAEVLVAARMAVAHAAGLPQTSAFKRVAAWKLLRQQVPGVKDKVLNLAIELALQ